MMLACLIWCLPQLYAQASVPSSLSYSKWIWSALFHWLPIQHPINLSWLFATLVGLKCNNGFDYFFSCFEWLSLKFTMEPQSSIAVSNRASGKALTVVYGSAISRWYLTFLHNGVLICAIFTLPRPGSSRSVLGQYEDDILDRSRSKLEVCWLERPLLRWYLRSGRTSTRQSSPQREPPKWRKIVIFGQFYLNHINVHS